MILRHIIIQFRDNLEKLAEEFFSPKFPGQELGLQNAYKIMYEKCPEWEEELEGSDKTTITHGAVFTLFIITRDLYERGIIEKTAYDRLSHLIGEGTDFPNVVIAYKLIKEIMKTKVMKISDCCGAEMKGTANAPICTECNFYCQAVNPPEDNEDIRPSNWVNSPHIEPDKVENYVSEG